MTTKNKLDFKQLIHKDYSAKKPGNFYISSIKWKSLVRAVLRAKNLMIIGPSGYGKTMAVHAVKSLFPERLFHTVSMGDSSDARTVFAGTVTFENGETRFKPSEFITAIQTPNAIIYIDESTRGHDDAINMLLPALDPLQRCMRLYDSPGTPVIKVADGVCFIATANIGSQYTTTRSMDRAFRERFETLEVDIMGKETQIELLNNKYNNLLDSNVINSVAEIAHDTRQQVFFNTMDAKLSWDLSPRIVEQICDYLVDGFTLPETAELIIYPMYAKDSGAESERTYMQQLVQRYCVVEEELVEINEVDENVERTIDPNRKPFD